MIRLFQTEKLIRNTFNHVELPIYLTVRTAIWNRPFYARNPLFALTLQIFEDEMINEISAIRHGVIQRRDTHQEKF